MAARKFSSASDAAEYAVTLTNEWKTPYDDIWDAEMLRGVMDVADTEDPLDEDDPNAYYLVDENGAVGLTYNAERTVRWCAIPTRPRYIYTQAPQPRPCPGCGAPAEVSWKFCKVCGRKL